MRILVIASWYPTADRPLRGIFFKEQVEALARRGHEVTVVVPERRFRGWNVITPVWKILSRRKLDVSRENGISVWRNPNARFLPASRFPLTELRLVRSDVLDSLLLISSDSGRFDIVHAHSAYWGGAVGLAISRELGVPLVITEHRSNILSGSFPPRVRSVLRKTYASSSLITAVSAGLEAVLCRSYAIDPELIRVIPNLVSPVFFQTAPAGRKTRNRFCCIAGIVKIKRHDLVLEAFALVHRRHPEAELVLVGDGPLHNKLAEQAQFLGIEDAIEWRGMLAPPEVAAVLSGCDALILASDHETFGVVLTEAWACGVPVIATRCGGPDGLVNEDNGVLVERNDPIALASAITDFIEARLSYNPAKIRESALASFGEEAVIERFEEAYRYTLAKVNAMEVT